MNEMKMYDVQLPIPRDHSICFDVSELPFFFCNINIKIWHSNEFLHIADYDGRDVASNAPNLVILLPMIFFVGLRLLK